MKISLDFSKQESKKHEGEFYLKLRIYNGQDQRIISTGVYCKPELYDSRSKTVLDASKMAEIQQMIYVYTNIIKSLTNDGKEFKAQDVVDLYK